MGFEGVNRKSSNIAHAGKPWVEDSVGQFLHVIDTSRRLQTKKKWYNPTKIHYAGSTSDQERIIDENYCLSVLDTQFHSEKLYKSIQTVKLINLWPDLKVFQ